MNTILKKRLYESIMKNVAKAVKKQINENTIDNKMLTASAFGFDADEYYVKQFKNFRTGNIHNGDE